MTSYRFSSTDYIDYRSAKPGQWFIGVICIDPRAIYITPVNIFESHNNINTHLLANNTPRGMNRYASGAPGERDGKMSFFRTFAGGNWLVQRPIGQTHHTAVMLRNKLPEATSYGFTIIKINNFFAQLKLVSNSLNTKPDYRKSVSFSQITYYNDRGESGGRVGMNLMPKHIEDELVKVLKDHPYCIKNIAVSLD